jgi:hypothetical protein
MMRAPKRADVFLITARQTSASSSRARQGKKPIQDSIAKLMGGEL